MMTADKSNEMAGIQSEKVDTKDNGETPTEGKSSLEEAMNKGKKTNGGGPGGPRGMRDPNAKLDKNSWNVLKRVLGYMIKSYKFSFLVVLICIVVVAFTNLVSNLFLQSLIDDYIIPLTQQATPDFGPLKAQLVQLAAFLFAGVLCAYGYMRIMVNISQGTLRNLRINLFDRMETLPIKYFDTHPHGDIMSVYTNDIDTLRQLISQSIPQLISSTISVLVTMVSMFILNVPLTVLSLVMVGFMLFATTKLANKAGTHFINQQADLGAVNGYIEEMVEGQKVVKVFNHEEAAIRDFEVLNDQLNESAYKANMYSNITMPVNNNIGNISYVLCAIFGAVLALNGFAGLTLGTLVAFLSLNRSFSMPVTQVSQQVNFIVMAMAGAERVFKLMDEIPEENDGTITLVDVEQDADGNLEESDHRTGSWAWKDADYEEHGRNKLTKMEGDIRFEDVVFGYNPDKVVLHNISLFAKPGQKIAFVGETGAGKTTITNLINRFYDIQSGSITYDGIDIGEINKIDLRHSLAIVLQDVNLFTGTVMENIRYGKLDATDEECIEAAKLANADGFVRRLPDGYQTMLTGNGGNLSQGQRQLISIARAAVADPPVLILDEATSSIDTRTEELVQEGMDRLMEGRTSFVIAHRLSTVRNSDCIMVLDHGRIIERGDHDDLINQKGKYYQLYTGNAIGDED
ncbi:MAG: ABC transporter ATP-binding protein [Coriobacteriales bacterium]|jgi:ATP-binding cassette subfamily B multidrug efflux pump